MLNPQLDVAVLHEAYARQGALSIQNVMRPEVADQILDALLKLDWTLEINDYSPRPRFRVPLREISCQNNLSQAIEELAHGLDTSKLFYLRLCVEDSQFTDPILKQFADYLGSEPFLAMMRAITGRREVTHPWIEATCYDKGCFLGGHRDDHHPDNVVAFVFNFTRHWQLDWGGLLMLLLGNQPPTIVPPLWNSLSMFTVPLDHLVSCVSPAATAKRYSITGWLRR
jgi:Rps23 Pro-64 3,4-dihydroxylase Tpa1-like proline 4-hydroxylase